MITHSHKRLPRSAPPVVVQSPALHHAAQLLARDVPCEEWPDAALDAYAADALPATKAWLASLTDEQLDAVCDARSDAPQPPPGVVLG